METSHVDVQNLDIDQEETGEVLPVGAPEENDEFAHLAPTWENPIRADEKDEDETEEDRLLFFKERQCILLLLEARRILDVMITKQEEIDAAAWAEKLRQEEEMKKKTGKMSVQEIQQLLQSNPEDDSSDWVNQLQELKKQLVIQVRKNHQYDKDVSNLEKKISLLIKNKGNITDLLRKGKKRRGGEQQQSTSANLANDPRKLASYQNLFYLLQTEPKYLAKIVYLVNAEQMESFLETTILTLYGDAFSPREEFLILRLFQLAIQHEMSIVKSLSDFLGGESVVPKMVITYNRRKMGLQYLKKTLSPLLSALIEKSEELNFDLQPKLILNTLIQEGNAEAKAVDPSAAEADILQNPAVQALLDKRIASLESTAQQFLDGIVQTMEDLPYGIRWICKQLKESFQKVKPEAPKEDVLKLEAYFVFYRFLNLAIVTPDAYNVVDSNDIPPLARKNLVVVAKVLQSLFNFKLFNPQTEKVMTKVNGWIERSMPTLYRYFDDLPRVRDPEDHLQVNQYVELTNQSKPVIMITMHEIFNTHALVSQHLDSLAPDKEDPLRKILLDLGPPPANYADADDREIQLTLTNRFEVQVQEESELDKLYAETKELVIPILRMVPIQNSIQRLNLMDVLEHGIKTAMDNNDKDLTDKINKILANLGTLEKEEVISKEDNYESFVQDVALEVANRATIREQQRKEITRLKHTLEGLRNYEKFVTDQIEEYQTYCDQAIAAIDDPNAKKPKKFKYSELQKRRVIIDSEVPSIARGKTKFLISRISPGVFQVKPEIPGFSNKLEPIEIRLDDLLGRQYNNMSRYDLGNVTLDVDQTIILLNENFLKKKK